MSAMAPKAYEIQRRLGFLERAEKAAHVGQTGRYFDINRASVCHWMAAFGKLVEAGLVREEPTPRNP